MSENIKKRVTYNVTVDFEASDAYILDATIKLFKKKMMDKMDLQENEITIDET